MSQDLDPTALAARLAKGDTPVLLDVREQWEFDTAALPKGGARAAGDAAAARRRSGPRRPTTWCTATTAAAARWRRSFCAAQGFTAGGQPRGWHRGVEPAGGRVGSPLLSETAVGARLPQSPVRRSGSRLLIGAAAATVTALLSATTCAPGGSKREVRRLGGRSGPTGIDRGGGTGDRCMAAPITPCWWSTASATRRSPCGFWRTRCTPRGGRW